MESLEYNNQSWTKQGGAREGAIAVPNPRDRRFVGKKVQSSQHFLFQD